MNCISRKLLHLGLMLIVLASLVGCGAKSGLVIEKSMEPPPIIACCSETGHMAGNVPFILGGNCFCTPSGALIEAMHESGQHLDVDFKKLVELYRDAGIATDLDHRGCNNLCEQGPHVAFGGHCMATPTPGTKNYEHVLAMIQPPATGKN